MAPAESPHTGGGAAQSQEELAKAAQNPVAKLISVPFQNNFNFGVGPEQVTQYILNVQPVIPISLNEDWNLITRTIVPIINQPSPAPGISPASGLGDINPTVFLSPAKSGRLIWGIGPTMTIPTATDSQLGNGMWTAGPAVVALTIQGPWVVGALANQQWSFAGWGDEDVSALLIQPFINYNLPNGWYLTSAPILTANWEADGGDKWTVPIGGGVGKIQRFGKLPLNLQLQAFYNVETPEYGPDWQLRIQVQFLFPK
ncbi:MAG: neuromedin U [Verrucomicrobia bacterium]|nr:neuromedin U [Verrucomicrobiota bacterium]